MVLCGFGILGEGMSAWSAYALCIVFSAVAGLIPVKLFDGAPDHAPRPELVGATVGFMMQGNNVGLVLGPAISGALAASFGWSMVAPFVAVMAVVAGALALMLGARPAHGVTFSPAALEKQEGTTCGQRN